MITVTLADDHAIVRHGIRQLVDAQGDMTVVAEVEDGAEVLESVAKTPCDVLVLDLSLPNVGGLEIIRRAQNEAPAVNILVLSMYPEDQLALHLLEQGAKGYLNKGRHPREVLAAIRRVAQGKSYVTEEMQDLKFERQARMTDAPHDQLTPRERQVFMLLVEGRLVSEIAGELDLSPSTVSNHVARIKDKLGTDSIAGLVRYAQRTGLLTD